MLNTTNKLSAAATQQLPFKLSQIDHWVDTLPLCNRKESCVKLFDALSRLRQMPMEPGTRLDALKTIKPAADHLCLELQKQQFNLSTTQRERLHQLMDAQQALTLEMALGFELVAQDFSQKSRLLFKKRHFAQGLYWAVWYFSQELLLKFQQYSAQNAHLWKQLHQLYQLAQQHNLHQLPLDKSEPRQTLTSLYLSALTVSLANPYQLRPREIVDLHRALLDNIHECQLQVVSEAKSGFIVDLRSDRPPSPAALTSDKPSVRYHIHLEPLRRKIQSWLKQPSDSPLADHLLRLSLRNLQSHSSRHFARTQQQDPLRLILGLATTSKHLSQPTQTVSPPMDMLDQISGELVHTKLEEFTPRWQPGQLWKPLAEQDVQEDIWGHFYRPEQKRSAREKSTGKVTAVPPAVTPAVVEAHQINASPGGYCVKLNDNDHRSLQTGDVVGIEEPQHTQQATAVIGVVRWLKCNKDGHLEAGIQLLAPNARPIKARASERFGKKPLAPADTLPEQYGLLLPELKNIGQPASLLLPRQLCRPHRRLLLEDQGEQVEIELQREMDASPSYRQFSFKTLSKNPVNSAPPPPRANNNWELI